MYDPNKDMDSSLQSLFCGPLHSFSFIEVCIEFRAKERFNINMKLQQELGGKVI
jgi:hypothetical protein